MIKKIDTQIMLHNKKIFLFEIKNNNNASLLLSNYGGTILKLNVPNKNNELVDVVLGFDEISDYYTKANPYFGSVIGRYSNRIQNAKFTLNSHEYILSSNENQNQLHGGKKGFDKKIMYHEIIDDNTIKFIFSSKDTEEGFPGNVKCEVTYTFTNDNKLEIKYKALTDKDTVINLTNHSYFNLDNQKDVLDHKLQIFASGYNEIDEQCIPLGTISDVCNTPFDFNTPHKIGERIHADFDQLKNTKGYDHNYVINKQQDDLCAIASSDKSGITMAVYTNKPGVQLYTGNNLNIVGKKEYKPYSGFCLETQFFPNSPNVKEYPSCILKKGDVYNYYTVYAFSVS